MAPQAFDAELEVARKAALAAGEAIARRQETDRESWEKSADHPVTQADLEANEIILETIRSAFPEDTILSEETRDPESRLGAERVWIVDPLDGTKEFIARIPEFAVSIALALRGQPVVGVVHEPLGRECFAAARGLGAQLNGEPISISNASTLKESVALVSRTETKRGQLRGIDGWLSELRPVGSVALKLAWIAAGRGEIWVSMAPKSEWDVCAGDLLVREAGGVFAFADGERTYNQADVLLQPPMAAGPAQLVEELLGRIGER
ncbi:MAG: 3'(2'),5'-bisphosphate nucleotidase CysQ [Myxococcota bacterium]